MKTITTILLLVFLLPFPATGQQKIKKDTIKVFYLGGQSNMDGYGLNAELPDSLRSGVKNVWIFHGNPAGDDAKNGGQGTWETLKPGHGGGFVFDGKKNKLSKRFGPELSLAWKLQQLYPNEKIALIKYSKGGSSIDSVAARNFGCWEPDYRGRNGINQYDHFLTTITKAFAVDDINGDGRADYLKPCGILWMQGESDGHVSEAVAKRYYTNLNRLMELIRAALRVDNLPVVLGKISDSGNHKSGKVWPYGDLVEYAQEKYAKTDGNAAIVRSTDAYSYSDPWHYDSKGYIDLGIQFAVKIYTLNKERNTGNSKD